MSFSSQTSYYPVPEIKSRILRFKTRQGLLGLSVVFLYNPSLEFYAFYLYKRVPFTTVVLWQVVLPLFLPHQKSPVHLLRVTTLTQFWEIVFGIGGFSYERKKDFVLQRIKVLSKGRYYLELCDTSLVSIIEGEVKCFPFVSVSLLWMVTVRVWSATEGLEEWRRTYRTKESHI